jgi:hypothetical protein
MAGQPLVDTARDVAHLGKLFHENAFAFGVGVKALVGFGSVFGH